MSERDGGPAFPGPTAIGPAGDVYPGFSGMSLRDWFAGHALAGLLAHASGEAPESAPRKAYQLADAMLAVRAANSGEREPPVMPDSGGADTKSDGGAT